LGENTNPVVLKVRPFIDSHLDNRAFVGAASPQGRTIKWNLHIEKVRKWFSIIKIHLNLLLSLHTLGVLLAHSLLPGLLGVLGAGQAIESIVPTRSA